MPLLNKEAFFDILRKYIPAAPSYTPPPSGLAGGPSSAFAGHNQQTAAAQANISSRRPHYMALIATRCDQVKQSLATGGASDTRDLWYLGHITLSTGCEDGDSYAHQLGQAHPHYSRANTDAELQRARDEVAKKSGLGYPTCAKYNIYRQGVCPSCPHWNKIRSPLSLGVESYDMPPGYRRERDWIEGMIALDKKSPRDWIPIVKSIAADPRLVKLHEGHRLEYTHNKGHFVHFDEAQVPESGSAQFFARQHITLQPYEAKWYREFVVAWIKHLKEMMMVRDAVEPFTWTDAGFAVGTRLYRADGTVEPIVCADHVVASNYTPSGDQLAWTAAANDVARSRVDIQVVIASAFAAPLVQLGAFGGGLIGAAYAPSGYAKSTAAVAGQTVWGAREGILKLDDTPNYTAKILGTLHSMPLYLDELASDTDDERKRFVRMLFRMSLGTDKHRLDRNANSRDVGSWESMCMLTTNDELMDVLITETGSRTDAAALRLFAFPIESMYTGQTNTQILGELARNRGTAGAVYAAWLARNRATVKQQFTQLSSLIHIDFAPQPGERFYIGYVICTLLGASIAQRLGLVDFDLTEMYTFLKTNFNALRMQRNVEITTILRVPDVLNRFIETYQPEILVTDIMITQQNNKATPQNIRSPAIHAKRVEIHIATKDLVIRINRGTFIEWCTNKNIPWSNALKQMQTRWGANTNKRGCTIGRSQTNRWTYTTRCIEIALAHPELTHILDIYKEVNPLPTGGMAPAMHPQPTGTP